MKIYASDLSSYVFCPRTVYLSRVLDITPPLSDELVRGRVEHAVRKEFSLRQPRVLEGVSDMREIRDNVFGVIDSLVNDFSFICREIISRTRHTDYDCRGCFDEVCGELRREADVVSMNLGFLVDAVGVDAALQRISPWRTNYFVCSEALGLSGCIDKVMRVGGVYAPVEIKTGSPPSRVWWGDVLQVCSYAMLLGEELGSRGPVNHGFVEYARAYERRPVVVSERLREAVMETRDRVAAVVEGGMPDVCFHSSARKCRGCSYRAVCQGI